MATTTGATVLTYLGQPTDTTLLAQANLAVATASAAVDAYCRGRQKKANGSNRDGVDEVILTVATRLVSNPEQIAYDMGSVSMRSGMVSFSLLELAILNRYRKQAT